MKENNLINGAGYRRRILEDAETIVNDVLAGASTSGNAVKNT
jgi:hypothetical protein